MNSTRAKLVIRFASAITEERLLDKGTAGDVIDSIDTAELRIELPATGDVTNGFVVVLANGQLLKTLPIEPFKTRGIGGGFVRTTTKTNIPFRIIKPDR